MGRRGTGSIFNKPNTKNLYIRFYVGGEQKFEAVGSPNREEAQRLLNLRLGEVVDGTAAPSDSKKLTYDHMRAMYITSKPGRAEYSGLKHIDVFFGGRLALKITSESIGAFVAARRKAGISDPTIKRNLTPLRAMFNHAKKMKKIGANDIPWFDMPEESDPVGQYIPPEMFVKILAALPTRASTDEYNRTHERHRSFHDLRPFFGFLYSTGCRVGAAQKIRWEHVSEDCTEINLPGRIIKTRQPLFLPLAGKILEPIAIELRKRTRDDAPVFDATNYRPEWNKACAAAGLRGYDAEKRMRDDNGGGRIHDMRVSGAINLLDSGVPESTVMQIGGWKTRKMLDHYNRVDRKRATAALVQAGDYVHARMTS